MIERRSRPLFDDITRPLPFATRGLRFLRIRPAAATTHRRFTHSAAAVFWSIEIRRIYDEAGA
jgi:hypothetical protein